MVAADPDASGAVVMVRTAPQVEDRRVTFTGCEVWVRFVRPMMSTVVEYLPAGCAGKAPLAVQGGHRLMEDLMGVGRTFRVSR